MLRTSFLSIFVDLLSTICSGETENVLNNGQKTTDNTWLKILVHLSLRPRCTYKMKMTNEHLKAVNSSYNKHYSGRLHNLLVANIYKMYPVLQTMMIFSISNAVSSSMYHLRWVELNWLFNVTINDISVIYVTAHRCAGGLKKKLDLRSGSQRHRHFVGFFNVPVLAPTRDQPFYTVIPTHRPI